MDDRPRLCTGYSTIEQSQMNERARAWTSLPRGGHGGQSREKRAAVGVLDRAARGGVGEPSGAGGSRRGGRVRAGRRGKMTRGTFSFLIFSYLFFCFRAGRGGTGADSPTLSRA